MELFPFSIFTLNFAPLSPTISTFPLKFFQILSNFEKHGFFFLNQFGSFIFPLTLSASPLFLPFSLHFPSHQYYLTRDWPTLSDWFQFLPLLLHTISLPDLSILLS